MSEWISVVNRRPAEDGDYLTYLIKNDCSYRIEVQRFCNKRRELAGTYGKLSTNWELTTWDDNIVTHWMPLPEPPK